MAAAVTYRTVPLPGSGAGARPRRRVVAEEFSPTSGVVTEAGDGRSLLTTGADSLGALTFHLAALGADFTVLEPPELIDFVRDAAVRLRRAGDRSGPGGASPAGRGPGHR